MRTTSRTPQELRDELRLKFQLDATQTFNRRRRKPISKDEWHDLTVRFTTLCEVCDFLEAITFEEGEGKHLAEMSYEEMRKVYPRE